ncbi:MAG: UDP-N-acetylmuramate--L-alanine ligase [Clostridia bacterium]|nr:UDP-N-acetylmuramate--L-alanine ligase [Clostridia bacterium]
MDFLSENKLNVFIIGICGVGTSGIAKYLKSLGFFVSGSDNSINHYYHELIKEGIVVYDKHDVSNLIGCDVVIYSSAIKSDNVELKYAIENNIPIFSRAEILSMIEKKFPLSIGVVGAHGKTTTTAILSNVLKAANLPFTAFIGGSDLDLSNYCNFGKSIFLAEICEYKRNIEYFKPDVGIVLNIDNDHLDCYKDFNDLAKVFNDFIKRTKYSIVNYDDKNILKTESCVSFGKDRGEYTAENITYNNDGGLCFTVLKNDEKFLDVNTRLKGEHNVYNVLAAVAAADKLNIGKDIIQQGLQAFKGVLRRDEYLGNFYGAETYADYAHHPKEIKKYIDTYKNRYKKIHVVFQPHTYSRTRILFNDFIEAFKNADNIYIFKTFPARESFNVAGSALRLAESIPDAIYYDDFDFLLKDLAEKLKNDDVLLVIGAGDIYDLFKENIKKMRN